jgi:hypothetical protein
MRVRRGRLMIVLPMGPNAAERLSPELVLVLPPEEAALARLSLPDPVRFAPLPVPAVRRSSLTLRRAAGLVALYTGVLAVTVTPLGLMLKAVPTGHRSVAHDVAPRVDRDLPARPHHTH